MKTSSLIGHVVEVLDIIHAGRQPADGVVKEFFRARHYLGASDRRFIAARTFDILRHHGLLTLLSLETLKVLQQGDGISSVPSVMLVAAHEARCGEKTGGDVVADFEGLWRVFVPDVSCAAFLDAFRHAEIPQHVRENEVLFLSARYSIPEFVVRDWVQAYGREEAEALCTASNGTPPITIRVNTLRGSVPECRQALEQEGIATSPTVLSPFGLILPKRINAHGLHSFRQGWFEMQDEGSQLLGLLLEARPGMTVVDACAGGGGKSLHLAALMENKGTIVAVDVDTKRLDNFVQRGRRAGVTIARTVTSSKDTGSPCLEGIEADAVLIDAPCSGVGTFRRNPGAKLRFTEDSSQSHSRTQRALLDRYASTVRPGGRLVYTTCTLIRQENKEVVEGFVRDHREFSVLSAAEILGRQSIPNAGMTTYLELLPNRLGTDGYFGAVLSKQA